MGTKSARLEVLRMIISNQELQTQEELIRELARSGYDCTQSTLSRDLRQLGVVKGLNEERRYVYLMPRPGQYRRVSDTHMTVHSLQRAGALGVKFTGSLAVVRTLPGHASHVALDIDAAASPLILGTIAGDDTVFVAYDESADRAQVLDVIATAMK